MRSLRVVLLIFAVLIVGCTHVYSHAFRVESIEPLQPDEQRSLFIAFKAYLAEQGMREVTSPDNKKPDYAAFVLGGGRSGLMRHPFNEYLELSYTSNDGFIVEIVRVISHPVDFSDQYISEFKLKTEQFIHEATSKNVRLQIVHTSRP